MAKKLFWVDILVMVLVIGMTVVGCDNDSTNNKDIEIIFENVNANGSTVENTTQLTLTFNKTIKDLSVNDITLSGVPGVQKENISVSDTMYTLIISGFSSGGTLTVAIAKPGYNISSSSKTVTIYKPIPIGSWITPEQYGLGGTII